MEGWVGGKSNIICIEARPDYIDVREWRPFDNKARKDGLKLSHWVKASSDPAAEYPFAKYNVPAQTFTYTDEEYDKLLQDEDWTKEETDYLFSLIHEYDVRFHIVADRYDFQPSPPQIQPGMNDPAAVDASSNQSGNIAVKEEVASPEKMDIDEPVKTNGVNGTQEAGPSQMNVNTNGSIESAGTVTAKPRRIEVCARYL
jgi:hypothetical protein